MRNSVRLELERRQAEMKSRLEAGKYHAPEEPEDLGDDEAARWIRTARRVLRKRYGFNAGNWKRRLTPEEHEAWKRTLSTPDYEIARILLSACKLLKLLAQDSRVGD